MAGDELIVGTDVGGTFTDVVIVRDGEARSTKVLTTPHDLSEGVMSGCVQAVEQAGSAVGDVAVFAHATTVATNALIERKGARTGLLTTSGFEDVLEVGNEGRYHIYDLLLDKPAPLVERRLRRGVTERTDAAGNVLVPVDGDSVVAAARDLVALGAESLAVCFLHAPVNPANEREAGAIVREALPDVEVCLSSEVAPEIREWERTTTTAANAYVRPLIRSYLSRLGEKLQRAGIACDVHVMVSDGGIATAEMGGELPIRLLESGPAAGVMAAAHYGASLGIGNVLAFDMGGTTAKICLIRDGAPRRARQFEAARVRRFQRGSGLPIKMPVIELIEIGAGGGSIARVDEMGLLKVGPESAGASPGPACYALGGEQPTVSDADLVLGYLNPDYFLGGAMPLDAGAARTALGRLGGKLGFSVEEAAAGVYQVVNESMAVASRVHAVEQGEDPRTYQLMAFGGCGPVHAYEVARRLKLHAVACPPGAGTLSALGLLVAPRGIELARSSPGAVAALRWDAVRSLYAEMKQQAAAVIASSGVGTDAIEYELSAELRYVGQGFEVEVPLSEGVLEAHDADAILAAFEASYRARFGRIVPGGRVEAVTWRLRARAAPHVASLRARTAVAGGQPLKAERPVYFPEAGEYVPTAVLDRSALAPGFERRGPCVIEEPGSTIVAGPASTVTVADDVSVVIRLDG